ncbi:hypothetical protein MLGJGCBP_02341 [Rhodococcus sp. T7]|nr:hypothetical protein MLGJGCBP_09352 [Rhodococcus sp. T7]KAF0964507.1 hypothetical protein MLGJGCBP_02341 [Rhodococcus sp. T7]
MTRPRVPATVRSRSSEPRSAGRCTVDAGAGVGVAVVVDSTADLTMAGGEYLPIAGDAATLPIAMDRQDANPSPVVRTVGHPGAA